MVTIFSAINAMDTCNKYQKGLVREEPWLSHMGFARKGCDRQKEGGISTLGFTYLMPAVKRAGLMRKRLLAESTILLSLMIHKRSLLKDIINTTPISPLLLLFQP